MDSDTQKEQSDLSLNIRPNNSHSRANTLPSAADGAQQHFQNRLKESVMGPSQSFENPGLLQELATLNGTERQTIEQQTAWLVEDIQSLQKPVWILFTKRNGDLQAPKGFNMEHATFRIVGDWNRCEQVREQALISLQANPTTRPLIEAALSSELGHRPVIRLFECTPNEVLLRLDARVPRGHSYGDKGRAVGFQSHLLLPANARLLQFLRANPASLSLLPHILRSSAVALNNESKKWVDAPIGGVEKIRGEAEHIFYFQDFPNVSISSGIDSRPPKGQLHVQQSPTEFLAFSHKQQLSSQKEIRRKTSEPIYNLFGRKKGEKEMEIVIPWADVTMDDLRRNFIKMSL